MADLRREVRAKRRIAIASGVTLAALGCAIAVTIAFPPRPLLVWNASASAPIGLYGITAPDGVRKGDMVIAPLAEPYRSFAANRHYLPANVPLVKRVAAMPGDRVCARGNLIFVNGRSVAVRRKFDAQKRVMPWWHGCLRLGATQFLLLMTDSPASFDGRYFGASDRRHLIGLAHALWTW